MFAMIGAQLALEARHRTGKGQFVDVSMLDGLMSTMAPSFAYFLGSGVVPKPMGTRFATIVPYRNFVCADREITIAVASDKLWESFCEAIGRRDLIHDGRFNSNRLRVDQSRCAGAYAGRNFSRKAGSALDRSAYAGRNPLHAGAQPPRGGGGRAYTRAEDGAV